MNARAGAQQPSGSVVPLSGPDPADDQAGFLDAVLDTLVDGVVACSRAGLPIIVNDAARALYEGATGTAWAEHPGLEWLADVLSTPAADEASAWRGPLQLALGGMSVRDVEVRVGSENDPRVLLVSGQPIAGPDGARRGAVMTLHDVTKERLAETLLAYDGSHDPRTGLPRRRFVVEHLAVALHEPPSGRVAVLAVEFEGYDLNAERFGFDIADGIIELGARTIAAELAPDDLLGHLDDGRFVVAVTHRAADRAEELAARIARAVNGPRPVPARADDSDETVEVHVAARVGVALADDGDSAESLLHAAHLATGDARQLGKHVVRFHRGGHDGVLEHALSKALDNGELLLHYQPKVELESRRTVGVEALVRWDRPGFGLVPPDKFIPVAEASGLIVDLGAWVLREACAEAQAWLRVRGALAPLRVSVNVSPRQFDASVAEVVHQSLAACGLPPGLLCLEVTESVVMRDVDAAIATLNELRELGVTVSLDDFGTGYSSLAYLRRFPVTELKIDRSFVAGLGEEPANTALVGGIVSVAHALDLDAVAEGVETEEQMVALSTAGCDIAQGYYISRPLTSERVREFVSHEFYEPAWTEDGGRPARVTDATVLVADDADDVRLLARMTLTTSGFEVHEARDGTTALGLAKSLKPGIVVLDVHMPGMDGLTLCRALRDDPETADATIVVLTATAEPADKISAYSAGADDYIVKPFSPRELASRVRAAQRRRAESERSLA